MGIPFCRIETYRCGESVPAARALVGLVLYSCTLEPALEVALVAVHSSDPLIRGNALLSFGHLARRFGVMPRDPVYGSIVLGLSDADPHIRGQADAAADDVQQFLGWHMDMP